MDPNHDLSPEVKHYLQQQLKFHPHPDVRERILIYCCVIRVELNGEIADLLGCSLRKVAYWSVHGDPGTWIAWWTSVCRAIIRR
jgi:hypothetical protein